jgi:hypothetical protein
VPDTTAPGFAKEFRRQALLVPAKEAGRSSELGALLDWWASVRTIMSALDPDRPRRERRFVGIAVDWRSEGYDPAVAGGCERHVLIVGTATDDRVRIEVENSARRLLDRRGRPGAPREEKFPARAAAKDGVGPAQVRRVDSRGVE